MNEAIFELILAVLAAIATGAITLAVAFLQSKIKSEKTGQAVGRLGEVAAVTVGELQQTLVEGWKAAGGGKLSKNQAEAIKQKAIDKIKQKMDEPALSLLDAVGADIDALIAGFVEDAVRKIKNEDITLALPVEAE